MRRVLKYEIPQDVMNVQITGRRLNPLHVGTPQGAIHVWVEQDEDSNNPERTIELQVFGTGHSIPDTYDRYVGTFKLLDGAFIGHVYARQIG